MGCFLKRLQALRAQQGYARATPRSRQTPLESEMPVNWKNPKAFERLLAAMVAAQETKVSDHSTFFPFHTCLMVSCVLITSYCISPAIIVRY